MPRPLTPSADHRLPPGRHGIAPALVREDQRWRLLGACARLVAERGYAGVTVRALVEAAAVSKATFYREFDGLPACFRATYEMAAAAALAAIREACDPAADPAAALAPAVAAVLELLAAEPSLAHVLTDAALDDVEGLPPLRSGFAERCAALLAASGGLAEAERRRGLSLHRVRATRGWVWERLHAGTGPALPQRAPELARLLAA